jgi:hypothetical protein
MISITQMTRCPLPDQRKIYRPAAICIAKSNLSLQNAKIRSRPIHDRIDASRTPDNRANNTKSLLLFLLSVTNFHHFSEKFLAVSDPRRRRPRRPGTNSVRAMTLRTITSAMRELHEDKGKAFIADRIEILVDRVHHGAGYTAR